MTTGVNPDTLLEIARIVASLGVTAAVVIVLAWRSPQLAHEFFSFVRGLIGDFRQSPKRDRKPRPKQTSSDPAE
jgi:hypothetical protein